MDEGPIADTKARLRADGFSTHAVLPDDQFRRVTALLDEQADAVDTPAEELRYIEGRLDLPMGHLARFRITTPSGRQRCACGRGTTALDIVDTAVSRRLHHIDLLRNTLIGFRTTLEFADEGREGQCYACGRSVVAFSYWTHAYAYA